MNHNDMLDIQLIATAGILFSYNGVRILVDGIHHEFNHPFSRVPQNFLEEMMKGRGELRDIDYLLISHIHSDHCTPDLVMDYIENNTIAGVFFQRDSTRRSSQLIKYLETHPTVNWKQYVKQGAFTLFEENIQEKLRIQLFGVPHMGPQYKNILCACPLIQLGEKRILVLSDGDFLDSSIYAPFSQINIDIALVNPYWINQGKGREILREIIRPKLILIYHIPFLSDDTMNIQGLVESDIRHHGNEFNQILPLCKPGQRLSVLV